MHIHLGEYGDPIDEISGAVAYATSSHPCKGGAIYLAKNGTETIGVLVMLRMPTSGFVPENLLVYVAVDSSVRGEGVGSRLVKRAIDEAHGDVALHVDRNNPARRLYERMGFSANYLEMRYKKG